jgi:RNA polymerase sigma-70 factor (ECF subfamily)
MTISEYEHIVKTSSDKVFRILLKITKNRELCHDILQDIFLKLWENRSSVDVSFAEAWLVRSARNKYIDYLRLKDNQNTSLSPKVLQKEDENPQGDKAHDTLYRKVLQELENLPVKQKEIFLLKEMEGLTIKEIADYLDIGESKVKVTIHRIRKALRNNVALIKQDL